MVNISQLHVEEYMRLKISFEIDKERREKCFYYSQVLFHQYSVAKMQVLHSNSDIIFVISRKKSIDN